MARRRTSVRPRRTVTGPNPQTEVPNVGTPLPAFGFLRAKAPFSLASWLRPAKFCSKRHEVVGLEPSEVPGSALEGEFRYTLLCRICHRRV